LIRLLPAFDDDAVDVQALYPSHRSMLAKVGGFIGNLVEHLSRTAQAACPCSMVPRPLKRGTL
jgi:hypothetical protein